MPYDEICYQRVKQDKINTALKELEKVIKEVCK